MDNYQAALNTINDILEDDDSDFIRSGAAELAIAQIRATLAIVDELRRRPL